MDQSRLLVICCTWWQKQSHHPKHCILTNCGCKKWQYRFHLNSMCVSQTFRLSFHNLSSTYSISLYPEYCLLQVLFAHLIHSVHILKCIWVWSWYSIAASLPFQLQKPHIKCMLTCDSFLNFLGIFHKVSAQHNTAIPTATYKWN